MHRLIWERLEELLGEAPPSAVGSEVRAHLAACADCQELLEAFREQSRLLRVLRGPEGVSPAPGFYARVMQRIDARRSASVWSALLDPTFGWRLVFGSLAALLVLGGFLYLSEASRTSTSVQPPEAIIAVEEHPADLGLDPQRDREAVLVTLATYRE